VHISSLPHEQQYMLEMVEARRNSDKVEQHHDLFSGLLEAAQDEPDNGTTLNEEELIGKHNIDLYCIIGECHDGYSRKHVHPPPRRT
jgi:hypothetical protein